MLNSIIEIGKIVANRRDTLKITQEKLSAVSSVSLRTIREVEQGSGNPSFETLNKLFAVLGLEMMVRIKNNG